MRYGRLVTFILVACLTLPIVSTVRGDRKVGLELEPCTLELVDGTKIEGMLAVRFDMPDHLIVYSPRLATVRSFVKEHVHALTVDGRRRQLNAKRALTEQDKELLGPVRWPEEPPERGRKPAYTTETWTKPEQLLVWANPGKSGRFEEPRNWLLNGRAMKEWPRAVGEHYGLIFFEQDTTDFLFPASARRYIVRPRATSARPRHITAEAGVDAEIKLNTCTGNIWISPDADFDGGGGADLGGVKHTFFLNGTPYTGSAPTTPERFRELMASAESFGRKWVVRKDIPEASMTLIGSFGSGDETHWARGVTILEENSVIAVGPRCQQTIGREAMMVLKSGAVLGKRSGNQCYKDDMSVQGALLAGSPDDPLTRDCFLGISIKDTKLRLASERAKRFVRSDGSRGLTIAPGAEVRVYTADPAKARLVITWHGVLGKSGNDDGTPPGYFEKLPESERTINVNIFGDHVFRDMVFDWVGEGDIRLVNPEVRDRWQRVGFGKHNKADGDAIFKHLQLDKGMREQLARRRKPARVMKWARNERKKGARYPRILPSGGTFAAGETVTVRLDALSNPEMRYTLDGGASKDGKVYEGPFDLTETTTVKAGCFHYPPPHFYKQWAEVTDTFTFVGDVRKADQPDSTLPGLLVRFYEENDFGHLHDPPAKPEVTRTVERFELNVPDVRMQKRDGYLYTGYVEVGKPGLWRFYTRTEGPNRLYIGDRLVVDNHRRYRYDWNPAGSPPLESWGSLRLERGKHAIRLEYGRGSGFSGWPPWEPQENELFQVSYEGPGVEKQPIPAEALSRQPRWSAAITPAGGLHKGGQPVEVRLGIEGREDAEGVLVRYSLDGGDPTASSPVYEEPFAIKEDTTVKARCFRNGEVLPGRLAEARFVFLTGLDDAQPGLAYGLYHGAWEKLPDFGKLRPAKTGVVAAPDVDVTDRDSSFGLLFTGYLAAPSAGDYTFYTESDDGSALYIDGKQVVYNDGLHGLEEQGGKVTLGEGPHVIRIAFFQGGGGRSLNVYWRGPGIEKQAIPASAFSHRPGSRSAAKTDPYRVATGEWFLMRDGKFTITSERPDLPADELRWRAWAAAHRINKGPYWPYNAVRDHGKILERIEAPPGQRAVIEEIVRIAREGGEVYEKETKARYRELGALAEKAKQAGDKQGEQKYKKMQHVQVHGKLALQRAPFFEILSLLTDEQWEELTDALPKYQKLRSGMDAMKKALEQEQEKAQ